LHLINFNGANYGPILYYDTKIIMNYKYLKAGLVYAGCAYFEFLFYYLH
jgi:hypothetical protein